MKVIGFDTSAYTTSLALVGIEPPLTQDFRQVLPVRLGERGLRQSDAVFDHIRNLPVLMQQVAEHYAAEQIIAVGASVTPTPRPDSYMPVFIPGKSWAHSLALALKVPFYPLSHQEGHIRAGLIDSGIDRTQPLMAIHFSGGTSELMIANREAPGRYQIEVRCAGTDLAAGQLVDRVGVKLGLPFPSGAHLEKLSAEVVPASLEVPILPSVVTNSGFSFSGAEAEAMRQIERGTPPPLIAHAVFRCIANTLEKIIREYALDKSTQVLLAGGVMANQLIKHRLQQRLDSERWQIRFARPNLATDNAVGIALLTLEQHLRRDIDI